MEPNVVLSKLISIRRKSLGYNIRDKSVGFIGKMLGSTLRTLWELFGKL
jgi:hypothetical protein